MSIKFGSVCSGIEAASVAFGPLGWKAAWFAEIEPFPCEVLSHHYHETPNLGDMTALVQLILAGDAESPDLLCGGTPCQAFSVAGKRGSLTDARGNLSMTFCEIADAIDAVRSVRGDEPCIVLWENVPGVLSTRDNAFGCFLAQLCGGDEPLVAPDGWPNAGCVSGPARTAAWRVLDAQYFGLAQRRRRVFVVASARNGFDPAAVLFEFEGVRRDSAPCRQAGERPAPTIAARTRGGGGLGTDFDCDGGLIAKPMPELGDDCAFSLRASQGGGDKPHVLAFSCKDHGADASEVSPTLRSMGHDGSHANGGGQVAVAFAQNQRDEVRLMDVAGALAAEPGAKQQTYLQTAMAVRRTTPRECSRLQGFPDDYLDLKYADASKAHAAQVLHELWRAASTVAREGWRPGIVAALLTPEVLLAGVHGGWVSWSVAGECAASRGTLSGAESWPEGFVRALRQNETLGSSPFGREPIEQCARELGGSLSFLPHERSSAEAFLLNSELWADAQGAWPLRYALATPVQAAKGELTPDGPRYKALGNSWAVPCVRWIGERISKHLAGCA